MTFKVKDSNFQLKINTKYCCFQEFFYKYISVYKDFMDMKVVIIYFRLLSHTVLISKCANLTIIVKLMLASCVVQIATRVTAARYGVKLSPSFLVPSNWTGCLGVINNYESLLPNKKALFDIAVARTASAYLTSLALAVAAFIADGSFNGGDNAL